MGGERGRSRDRRGILGDCIFLVIGVYAEIVY